MAKEQFKLSKSVLSKAWKDAHQAKEEFKGGQGTVFEDGRYAVALTDAERGESKASGRDQVMFEFTFLDGDYKGQTKRDYNGLDRAESIPYLIAKIEAMGGEAPEDINDLEDSLKALVKKRPQIRVVLKTKNDYQNVYVDRLLEEGDESSELPTVETPVEEPVVERSRVSKEKPEPAEQSESDEAVDIEVGMPVRCMEGEDEVGTGTILSINEEDAEVTVKVENGRKQIFPAADLRLIEKPEPPKKKMVVRRK